MSDFVAQCRAEWARLGVPDALAEEMAAELASDIADADADGVSVEELLGRSASDPRAFAAAWASERGLIQPRRRRARLPLLAFTVVAALALIIAALLLVSGEPKVALLTHGARRAQLPAAFTPPPGRVQAAAAAPIEWILLLLSLIALGFAAWLWRSRSARAELALAIRS